MGKVLNLTKEEAQILLYHLYHPDIKDAIKRDKFIEKQLSKAKNIRYEEDGISWEE